MDSATQSFKTVLLLGALTGVLLALGWFLGGTNGATIALAVSLVMNLGSWWFSDKIVIKMTRAKEVQPQDNPGLHRMVEELSRNAGIPKPRVYMTADPSPNAFATGRGPGHAAVAVTQGLMQLLTEREVRGVLAHELGHIKHRDVLVSSVAAAIAGAIVWIAYMMRWVGIFGGLGGDDDDGNILVVLLLSILAPIAAMIIQMAISRSQEYKADIRGAEISQDPGALADALAKLSNGVKRVPERNTNAATVHHIVNGFSGRPMMKLFSTHPPIEDRISRLRTMAKAGRVRVL